MTPMAVLALVVALAGFPQSAPPSIPAGTTIEWLLQVPLDSGTVKLDQRFEGPTLKSLGVKGETVLPAGVIVKGFVSSVRMVRAQSQASLTLSFDAISAGGRPIRLRATVIAVLDPRKSNELRRPEAGPVTGVADGPGPLVGVFVNADGTIVAKSGGEVKLPAGTVLRIRLDEPLVAR